VVLATFIDVVRELGLPASVGAAVGATAGALIAHHAAKSRAREDHERTLEALAWKDEREAALRVLQGAEAIKKMRRDDPEVVPSGALHTAWNDHVLAPSRLVRDDDLAARAYSGQSVIFLAHLVADRENSDYAFVRAAEDVEEWARAWLRREKSPEAHIPPADEVGELARSCGAGIVSIEPLNELLAKLV
jgi:hypothetical protein